MDGVRVRHNNRFRVLDVRMIADGVRVRHNNRFRALDVRMIA